MSRMKPRGSWVAVAISATALFVALGGVSAASSFVSGLINGHRIRAHTVGSRQIARHGVRNVNINNGAVAMGNLNRSLRAEIAKHGATGPTGPKGPSGPVGPTGPAGANGSNPATPVVDVKTIAASSGNNSNPDSGDPGDGGWYFSGDGSGGSASLTGGELLLSGSGVDAKTAQGGIGIAKAFTNLPLKSLTALNYQWHVNEVNGEQAPTIHISVTGLANNSHFSNGFANLVLSPGLNNGVTVNQGVEYFTDGFAANAEWYSSSQTAAGDGDQDHPKPLSYFVSNDPNAVITQISLDNGGSSGGSGAFEAGADNLVLGVGGAATRYDFGG